LVHGIPFLKSEPHHFYCKQSNGKFESCTKEQICANNLRPDQYYADKSDSQYIDNWVEQADLLCQDKQAIGFIGFFYFFGVIIAVTICPVGYLSDKLGRKWVFIGSMVIEIISCYILLTANTINKLYAGMLLMGMAHPGRNIVVINYADEFLATD
jgi:MFS family permease